MGADGHYFDSRSPERTFQLVGWDSGEAILYKLLDAGIDVCPAHEEGRFQALEAQHLVGRRVVPCDFYSKLGGRPAVAVQINSRSPGLFREFGVFVGRNAVENLWFSCSHAFSFERVPDLRANASFLLMLRTNLALWKYIFCKRFASSRATGRKLTQNIDVPSSAFVPREDGTSGPRSISGSPLP